MTNIPSDFNYMEFLKEVYIDPIRSVTVIDDEYPTLDILINEYYPNIESPAKTQYKAIDVKRLQDAIAFCRQPKNNWMIDVHDGKEFNLSTIPDKISTRLHHSDLLILDYHLDGEDDAPCEQSLAIIKHLANNQHFNLIAVHTKGYSGQKEVSNQVFIDIVTSLQAKPILENLPKNLMTNIEEALDDWDIDEPDIRNKLISAVSNLAFLTLCRDNDINKVKMNDACLEELNSLYNAKPANIKIEPSLLIKWLFFRKIETLASNFATKNIKHFDWRYDEHGHWIKTDDLFLTILDKKIPISDISEHMLKALNSWQPHPHKLILTKLRNEIDSNGIKAAQEIINKDYLQAAWLDTLLNATEETLKTESWRIISKLWEELAYQIRPELGSFVERLSVQLKDHNNNENIHERFTNENVRNNPEITILHTNWFNCSKKIEGYHLTTGHILKIANTYWLCSTPMCDLEPNQKEHGFGQYMPVTLVQLYEAQGALHTALASTISTYNFTDDIKKEILNQVKTNKRQLILSQATHNNLLFIKLNEDKDDITCFSHTASLDGKSNPKSREYLAENHGKFNLEGRKITLYDMAVCKTSGKPVMEEKIATVVAELRYEYALNLLQRLGIAKTRIGLEFTA